MIAKKIMVLVLGLLASGAGSVYAADSDWLAIGIRAGSSSEDEGGDLKQYDIYTVYRLPWQWQAGPGWSLATRLNASIGLLESDGDSGAVVTLGPAVELSDPSGRLRISTGISPTYISEDVYGVKDLGGNFHFTSHLELNYRLGEHFSLGYRFHHTSNADIEDPNPGLDVHSVSLGYYF